mmetsp:Transcript_121736/g.355712  ORF Transcript_121736/g.355712 Transcript_121736/m.355712 type:complete len:235 (-) Transcript_121736:174-878(-)
MPRGRRAGELREADVAGVVPGVVLPEGWVRGLAHHHHPLPSPQAAKVHPLLAPSAAAGRNQLTVLTAAEAVAAEELIRFLRSCGLLSGAPLCGLRALSRLRSGQSIHSTCLMGCPLSLLRGPQAHRVLEATVIASAAIAVDGGCLASRCLETRGSAFLGLFGPIGFFSPIQLVQHDPSISIGRQCWPWPKSPQSPRLLEAQDRERAISPAKLHSRSAFSAHIHGEWQPQPPRQP